MAAIRDGSQTRKVLADKDLAAELGRHRGVVRRRAETLGLLPRRAARLAKFRKEKHAMGKRSFPHPHP